MDSRDLTSEESKNTKKFKASSASELSESTDDLEINFRALTDGLGFHQSKERSGLLKQTSIQHRISSTSKAAKSGPAKVSSTTDSRFPSTNMGDLNVFYGAPTSNMTKGCIPLATDASVSQNMLTSESQKVIEANFKQRVGAYVIDLVLISIIYVFTLFLLLQTSGLEANQILYTLSLEESLTYLSILFAFYYLFYFTLLEPSEFGTPGKSSLAIVLKKRGQNQLGIGLSFVRALLSLFFFPLLGFPALFDLHGKLTGTYVVERKK